MTKLKVDIKRVATTKKSISLVILMLISSIAPLLSAPVVEAHEGPNDTIWPREGSEDTGWYFLNATGANPINGSQAIADWMLSFAPGAQLENVSMEIRVDGSNDVTAYNPMLISPDTGQVIFDWNGNGWLGQSFGFDVDNPHQGRLSPNADVGATVTLPSGSEITEFILEVLAPSDPFTSLEPVNIEIRDYVIHPDDGRMYLAVDDYVIILDANSSPNIIDLFRVKNANSDTLILDLEIDLSNNRMLIATTNDGVQSIDLGDTSWNADLPDDPSGDGFQQLHITSTGALMAISEAGIFKINTAGTGWTLEQASGTTNWPSGTPSITFEHNNIVYVSLLGGGIARWDVSSNTPLSLWSTANVLHSDFITDFLINGNQLLISSEDNGIARHDLSGNFWLATWNSGNWLSSDNVIGMTLTNNQIQILTTVGVQYYNINSGSFVSSTSLSSLGFVNEGSDILFWPNSGYRSPTSDTILVTDGSAVLAKLEPANNPVYAGDLVIGSGPSLGEMADAMQFNGIVYVGSGNYLDRYSINQARWLNSVDVGADITQLANDGLNVYVGTDGSGVRVVNPQGAIIDTWDVNSGLGANVITGIDVEGDYVAVIHPQDGATVFNKSDSNSAISLTTGTSEIDSNSPTGVAIHNGVAYFGTSEDGLNRYVIANNTFLGSWVSTGINDVDYAPIAVFGTNPQVLHLGLQGYGVARKDLSTGEILTPFTQVPDRGSPGQFEILPNNFILSIEANQNQGTLFIGTTDGAVRWDGSGATELSTGGFNGGWATNPSQHFGFVFDGTTTYSATNIGVCYYVQTTIQDCINAQDGMPNWGVYSIGINSTTVFGGTNSGVGLIDKSTKTVVDTWEAGVASNNALIEVIGDVAYIGIDGLGVARYDIANNRWLTTWTDSNVLDAGNEDITGLVADIRPNHIWIGGGDGFQLINVTTGAEVYDIEKTNSLYIGSADPYDMMIYGDTLYYHQQFSSDSVYRIDIVNFTVKSILDAGAQLNENGGDVYDMEIIDDLLHVSVASGQWWNTEGSGGIAIYNLSSNSWQSELLPEGAVYRVTSFESSTGNMWISWGENKLEQYDQNGTKLGTWSSLSFPIREIIEYDGEILFATEDGVARFDEATSQWLSSWTPGNGLPTSADDVVYELWTDGSSLVLGTAAPQGWNGVDGEILHLDSSGSWTSWDGGSNGIPNGYPIAMTMCNGILHVAITANNGGVARFDLANNTILSSFTVQNLDDGTASAVACDTTSNILYVGYNDPNEPITRYNYNTNRRLASLSSSTHNIPSDPVWWGAMEYSNGKLAIGYDIGTSGDNVIGGGYAIISVSGTTAGSASILSTGSAVSSLDWYGATLLIGQAGGTSGYSHVDLLSQLGQNVMYSLPNLVSGLITAMEGNSTHLWAASGSWQNTGSGLLQGLRNPNGTVTWEKGWTIPASADARDMELVGDRLYITTDNRGLSVLNINTGVLQNLPNGIHNFHDQLSLVGDDLFIGLQGTTSTSAGLQIFNTTNSNYTTGKLIAGLPSDNINGFVSSVSANGQEMIYIATDNGIGRWNSSGFKWETSITALDGLPISYVEDIVEDSSGKIWIATPSGLAKYDPSSKVITTMTPANGLMGTSTWGLTTATIIQQGQGTSQQNVFVSHDGRGVDRPGATQINPSSNSVVSQHQFDQLPSNAVTAVAADIWGVHIATDIGPLTQWVRGTNQFYSSANTALMQEWPVYKMRSDGNYLITVGNDGATVLSVGNGFNSSSIHSTYREFDTNGGSVVANSLVVIATSNGLKIWNLNSGVEFETTSLRRADPLSLGFQLQFQDVSNYTHPGMQFNLVDANSTVTLSDEGFESSHGIMMQTAPLTFSSPVGGSATWAQLVDLKYNATLNLSSDPTLESNLQYIVDNGVLINGTRHVNIRLQSTVNSSMWVRMTYDWYRTETPIQGISLWDRPDDGGSTLVANWTLVHDDDFSRYLVYLNEGPWPSQPTVADLQPRTPDAAVSIHSRLQTDINLINGMRLQNGVEYYAVVVVEYNDGRFGVPSTPFGPAIPTDEVPTPPLWAKASTGEEFVAEDGEIFLEWAMCTALDLASTRVYASQTDINDVIGLQVHTELSPQVGNASTIMLDAGNVYWLGLTCLDNSGQEDLANATIIGPIVPNGGVDDGVPPPKLSGVWAEDVPNDDGGRVQIGWTESKAEDCAFVRVYLRPVLDDELLPPSNVDDFGEGVVVPDCETNMTIVDSMDDIPLVDGQDYWIGAVAFDKWLNGDTGDVTILQVTPYVNNINGGTIPERIAELNAWDHPNDDGTAIDISWAPSEIDDFDYYVIWVSEHDISDLSNFWEISGTEPGICGCLVMDKQWIDTSKSPIKLTINTALYGGDGLESSLPKQIIPDIELNVAVTVHDIKGNVYLDNLNTAVVTPINNQRDSTPPERLEDISLSDRPNDDGTAVLLEFELSDASDVAYYEIYAAAYSFTSVGQGGANGPTLPINTVDREPSFPITIEILAFDTLVVPNLPVTVAVVPVDWSGNAIRTDLVTATAISIDDGVDGDGSYLPEIDGIVLEWVDGDILVSWDHTTDSSVRAYQIYISENDFSSTNDADLVGEVSVSNSFTISRLDYEALTNKSSWWVGVSAKDDIFNKEDITPIRILAEDDTNAVIDDEEENSTIDLGEILTTNNVLMALGAMIVLILLLLVVRGGGSGKKSRNNKEYDLQEATWGIQARQGWDDVGSFGGQPVAPVSPPPQAIKPVVENDIYAAAERIQQPPQNPMQYNWQQPQQQPTTRQNEIDTSFLDDLL